MGGPTCGKRTALALAVGLAALAVPSVASAQAIPDASCPGPHDNVVTGAGRIAQTFTAQNSGLLTRAEVRVFKTGTPGDYIVSINAVDGAGTPTNTVLASTTILDSTVPAGIATLTADFAIPASVVAGQQYALVYSRPMSNQLGIAYKTNDPCTGGQMYSSASSNPFGIFCDAPGCDLVYAVFVVPDPVDSTLPDTQITKRPKDKTRKKTATFEFAGTDARAVSGFQCSLDGGGFAACISPFKVKVRKGNHIFQVRATDQAGNADGSPATDSWKVKKKKQQ